MIELDVPPWLDDSLIRAGLEGQWVSPHVVAQIAREAGAYALLLRLDRPVTVVLPRVTHPLDPGWYLYAGSAHGGGGLRARIGRHFRRGKRLRWHIDRLTAATDRIAALAILGGAECEIVARLRATGDFTAPVPGFGSSDCRCCESHLLATVSAEPL